MFADIWEEEPYTVLEKVLLDIPVFKVMMEDGVGRVKSLHRNQLLPYLCLPREISVTEVGKVRENDSAESTEEETMQPENEGQSKYSS